MTGGPFPDSPTMLGWQNGDFPAFPHQTPTTLQARVIAVSGIALVFTVFTLAGGFVGTAIAAGLAVVWILIGPLPAFLGGQLMLLGAFPELSLLDLVPIEFSLIWMVGAWETASPDRRPFLLPIILGSLGLACVAVLVWSLAEQFWLATLIVSLLGVLAMGGIHRIELVNMGLLEE